MGNYLERVNDDSDDESVDANVFDIKKIYWDNDGNLRHGRCERNRDEELIKLIQADTNDDADMTKLWMIIPSRWVRAWLLFAHFKVGDPPGPIDMLSLLKQDKEAPGGWRAKKGLLPPSTKFGEERPGHYRRISLEAWINLVDMYGVDGYALAVRGFPFDDTTRWRVFKNPKNININLLPEPVLPEEKKEEPKSATGEIMDNIADGFGKLFGSSKKEGESGKDAADKK